jgi:hypothetical protein
MRYHAAERLRLYRTITVKQAAWVLEVPTSGVISGIDAGLIAGRLVGMDAEVDAPALADYLDRAKEYACKHPIQ